MKPPYGKSGFIYCVGAIVFVIAICFAAMPFLRASQSLDWSVLATYSALGAWLQGVVTPALLIVATLSFWVQNSARDEASRSAAEANLAATGAIFIENLDRFANHLTYRCITALLDDAPAAKEVKLGDNNEGLTFMVRQLKRDEVNAFNGRPVRSRQAMRRSRYFRMLQDEVEKISQMGEGVGFDGLLDGRIREIRDLIKHYPPEPSEAKAKTG